jgi:glycosyltransferase involved in cell wall biosynthesis
MSISVAIPLHNKEPYIRRAIESVLLQNTPPDEIVVIDDGSTDGSADRVMEFSDPRIRLIQQPNAGESSARNRAIAEAHGDLIAFLDADDEWKPDFLTHIQRLYRNFPDCGAYATAYEIVQVDGRIYSGPIKSVPPPPWIGIIPNWFEMVQLAPPFYSSSIAIPRKICNDLGGFPSATKRGLDIMMWVRLGVHYPVAYSPSRQVVYHTEAFNRMCVTIPILEEPACARMMCEMLENNEVPHELLKDFKDYYARLQINKAKDMIKGGNSRSARVLLNKIRTNRRYFAERLKWLYISFLPAGIVKTIVQYRNAR